MRHRLPVLLLCAALLAAGGCQRPERGGRGAVGDTATAGGRAPAPAPGSGGGDVAPGREAAAAADSAGPDSAAAAVVRRFAARLPPGTLVRRGECPFECCTYREWTAEAPIPVVAAERAAGAPAFMIPAGQRFRADSGNVWITGLLLVAVTDSVGDPPYWSFAPGDTLVVLDPIGEGYFHVWHAGRVHEVEGFWELWHRPTVGRTIGRQRTEWWVHATLPDGRAGWFRAGPETRFNGADACA